MTWSLRGAVRHQRLLPLAMALALAGGVACSSAGSFVSSRTAASTTAPASTNADVASKPAGVPAAIGAAAGSAPVDAAAPAAARAAQAASPAQNDATVADTSAQILDRMVIRTAQLSIEVQNMESALSQTRAIAQHAGGFVSASDTHVEKVNDQDNMVANLTLQVRSESADSAMSDLRSLGKVTAETSGSQDVTDEYVDLDSNLRNLQATEAAILKLMDKATQIQDVLSLQRELTNVRGQIERIQGRKTYLERRTDMATITVGLRLPAPASTQASTSGWDPVATALHGWQTSLSLLRVAADVVIVVLAFSWWLLPVLAVAGYVLVRRRRTGTLPPAVPAA